MRTADYPKIGIEKKFIPYKWMETLIEKQLAGGVLLVFLSGRNVTDIRRKVREIKKFCKKLNYE